MASDEPLPISLRPLLRPVEIPKMKEPDKLFYIAVWVPTAEDPECSTEMYLTPQETFTHDLTQAASFQTRKTALTAGTAFVYSDKLPDELDGIRVVCLAPPTTEKT